MRILLILVIILNVMDALGIAIKIFSNAESSLSMTIGTIFDAALWPVSVALIATAILRIYPYKWKDNSVG